jgi:hypothetical protein
VGWIVPELGVDFTDDFEDMMIDYVFDKWIGLDPPKGSQKITDDNNNIRFHEGHLDYFMPYEISVLQGRTTADYSKEVSRRRIFFETTLTFYLRVNRLANNPNWIAPQLGNMERELTRITRHYSSIHIPGIKDFWYDDSQRMPQRNNEFAATNWESEVYCKISYEKINDDP